MGPERPRSRLTGWLRVFGGASKEPAVSVEGEADEEFKSRILEVPMEELLRPGSALNSPLVDSVLLIDADNDPHLPPDFPVSDRALVRIFLRTDAKLPRPLERRLGHLQFCVVVRSPRGGANAADFVMSLHVGMLHSTLPMQVPFKIVTNDTALSVMVQELQRIGRQAELWTSHSKESARSEPARASSSSSSSSSSRGSGRGRGRSRGGRSRSSPKPAAAPVVPATLEPAPPPATEAEVAAVAAGSGKTIQQVAAAYASRLARIKDPPSRLKTLLNDIKNRAAASGFTPEAILEELKAGHGVSVDDKGKVHISKG